MNKLSILYPAGEGIHFDMDYYINRHVAMGRQLIGPNLRQLTIEKGISGVEPGSQPTYIVIAQLWFDSMEVLQKTFAEHGRELVADIPNYTNSQPVFQVSEVIL